ncbi:hypothetical protein DRH14_02260 [Candidatus Shapirobacteria bacterium]|nr:MAG: hypothetical protein DRH14_02260 [Candidatus Shapirobacteria bacterium]
MDKKEVRPGCFKDDVKGLCGVEGCELADFCIQKRQVGKVPLSAGATDCPHLMEGGVPMNR